MTSVWLNGRLLDSADARLDVAERGFLLGEAAFETISLKNGALRRWDRHLSRLGNGLAYLNQVKADLSGIPHAVAALSEALNLTEGVIRVTIGGGVGEGFEPNENPKPTVLVTLRPRPEPPQSVRLVTLDGVRRGGVPSDRFKLAGYADNLAARREARASGGDMAVLRGSDGQPACCDVANLFWIDRDGAVMTPGIETGALPGTTRAAILDAASNAGLTIHEASQNTTPLADAVAVAVTNAVMGVVPVSSLDDRWHDTDHPVLQRLIALERAAD